MPYGYMKNPENPKEWLIDEPVAEVVRKIFSLCVEGFGPTQIAKKLTEEKIPTPTEHWISIGRKCSAPPAVPGRWVRKSAHGAWFHGCGYPRGRPLHAGGPAPDPDR